VDIASSIPSKKKRSDDMYLVKRGDLLKDHVVITHIGKLPDGRYVVVGEKPHSIRKQKVAYIEGEDKIEVLKRVKRK